MRVLVHDFSGHPFQVQLSRTLARMGHAVTHLYSGDFTSPKGRLAVGSDDPPTLSIEPIRLKGGFPKYQFGKRVLAEVRYGIALVREARGIRPDVILVSNTPVIPQFMLRVLVPIPHVHWWQDIFSFAARDRFPSGLGRLAANGLELMERSIVRKSEAVIAISEKFGEVARRWSVDGSKLHVIPNWAPLEEVPTEPDGPGWSASHGLDDCPIFLYAGTLGLKHNPMLLASLAAAVRGRAQVVVLSEGLGANKLREVAIQEGYTNLRVMPFEPVDTLWDALAAATVLIAVLEPEAAGYSVPSKVLTYLCAGRPILLAAPLDNLASQTVRGVGAGLTVAPTDPTEFLAGAERLLGDTNLARECGNAGRTYAEDSFEIGSIARKFEGILRSATDRNGSAS